MDKTMVIKKRKVLLDNAIKKNIVRKGSVKIGDYHVCAVCGRPLTTYINNRGGRTSYKALIDYYYLYESGLFNVCICYNVTNCYTRINRKETSHGKK